MYRSYGTRGVVGLALATLLGTALNPFSVFVPDGPGSVVARASDEVITRDCQTEPGQRAVHFPVYPGHGGKTLMTRE
jgi:hypothetical protein